MLKKWGITVDKSKYESMDKDFVLIDLTNDELKEQNGGLFFSPIQIFAPYEFYKGIIDGWIKSTQF